MVLPSQNPLIFVTGSSRSGTTMMGNIVGQHSNVFVFQELHFFEKLWTSTSGNEALSSERAVSLAAQLLSIQRDGILFQKEHRRFEADASRIVEQVRGCRLDRATIFLAFLQHEAQLNGKGIPCDHTPRNIFYIDEILKLYETARVVIMVRDPRDVLASQKMKWKMRFAGLNDDPVREALRVKANYHPVTTSMLWQAANTVAARWDGHEAVKVVRFEDVLLQPKRMIHRVCDFLGIGFEDTMLEISHVNSSYDGTARARSGITRRPMGRWQTGVLSDTEVYLCQRVTTRGMVQRGYRSVAVRPNPAVLMATLATWPLKLAAAAVFNVSKIRNFPEAIKRRFARSGG